MITTQSLAEIIAESRIEEAQSAIVATLAALIPDVSVRSHPGELDLADVLEHSFVSAPGITVGWSGIQSPRELDGSFHTSVQWVAYIVADAHVDLSASKRTEKQVVAHAIGLRLLRILSDPDVSSWGLGRISPPSVEPAPELRPFFTAMSYASGAVIFAVTWSQDLMDAGAPFFGDEATTVTEGDHPFDVEIEFPDGVPPEVRALYRDDEGAL